MTASGRQAEFPVIRLPSPHAVVVSFEILSIEKKDVCAVVSHVFLDIALLNLYSRFQICFTFKKSCLGFFSF